MSRIHITSRRSQLLKRKDGFKETRELDLFWKSRRTFSTSSLESKFEFNSVKEDNSQSWVRISYGTIRYVNNYIKYNTHNFASSYEEKAEPTSSEVIAARSKAKAKPQPRESSGTTTISLNERIWIDIVPSRQDHDSYKLSKRVINILRHNRDVNRERDGAVQFYKIKFLMWDHSLSTQNWSDNRWLSLFGCRRRTQTKISVLS